MSKESSFGDPKTFTVSNPSPIFKKFQDEVSTEEELRNIFWECLKEEPKFHIFFNEIKGVVGVLNILVEVFYEDFKIKSSASKKMSKMLCRIRDSLQKSGYIFDEYLLKLDLISIDKLKYVNIEDNFEKIRFAFKIGKGDKK